MKSKIPVFLVTYPGTLDPSYLPLSRYGAVYSVVETNSKLHPLTHLQEILTNIITR